MTDVEEKSGVEKTEGHGRIISCRAGIKCVAVGNGTCVTLHPSKVLVQYSLFAAYCMNVL